MRALRSLLPLAALWLACAHAGAEPPGKTDGHEWVSYRNAYRSMLWFEKYSGAKNLIQNHFQVSPREKGTSLEGLRLSLVGPSTRLQLALDGVGRTVLPLLKAAYDENAELQLSRDASLFRFQPRVSISARSDGMYEAGELRAACEQVLQFQRFMEPSLVRGRKCAGVRFSYLKGERDPQLRVKKNERDSVTLPVVDGAAFWNEVGEGYRTITYLFAQWPETGVLTTSSSPLAIGALFD